MRSFTLALLLALAAATACAAAKPAPPQKTDFDWFDDELQLGDIQRGRVERLTLRARAGESELALAEALLRAGQDCQARAEDVVSRAEELRTNHPRDARAPEAFRRAEEAATKLRQSASEAAAAADAVYLANSAKEAEQATRAEEPAPSPPPPPAPAPEPAPASPAPTGDSDLLNAAAEQAGSALAAKLARHKARSVVVTPAATLIGDEMPKLALAYKNKGGQADVYGRAFARGLAAALAKAGFKATFSSDVRGQLASAPGKPQADVSEVRILVYGALATLPNEFAAWELRAVDLNNDGILGETQGVRRAR
ncbi:MAG: hypothetical protein QM765_46815 [Myxococcales bacterium]